MYKHASKLKAYATNGVTPTLVWSKLSTNIACPELRSIIEQQYCHAILSRLLRSSTSLSYRKNLGCRKTLAADVPHYLVKQGKETNVHSTVRKKGHTIDLFCTKVFYTMYICTGKETRLHVCRTISCNLPTCIIQSLLTPLAYYQHVCIHVLSNAMRLKLCTKVQRNAAH